MRDTIVCVGSLPCQITHESRRMASRELEVTEGVLPRSVCAYSVVCTNEPPLNAFQLHLLT
jgi:hypothetical protein